MTERAIWEYSAGYDGEVAVVATGKGVRISVTEEKAVDSSNVHFTCSIDVPLGELSGIKALIDAALAHTALADAELLAAYQRSSGEPGDPEADALLAEIERRDLDA